MSRIDGMFDVQTEKRLRNCRIVSTCVGCRLRAFYVKINFRDELKKLVCVSNLIIFIVSDLFVKKGNDQRRNKHN